MTGIPIRDPADGIWDDGEWISWAYINQFIDDEELPAPGKPADRGAVVDQVPPVEPQGAELLTLLMDAIAHSARSRDPAPQWGRIGELYVAERFGLALTKSHSQGHDGRLEDDLVEIKTITPNKRRAFVSVKRSGNFNYLAVVRVDANYQLDARLIPRSQLPAGDGGRIAIVSWKTACRLGSASSR